MKLLILLAIVGAGVLGCDNLARCGQCGADKKTCAVCWGSFFTNGECKKIATVIDKCLAYKDANTCLECEEKYYLSASNKCTQIDTNKYKNCLVARSDGECVACSNGKIGTANKCPDKEDPCKVTDCKSCDNETSCSLCKDNYVLLGTNECIPNSNKLSNCVVAATKTDCQKCKNNFRISNGACIAEKSSKIASVFALVAGILGMVLLSA